MMKKIDNVKDNLIQNEFLDAVIPVLFGEAFWPSTIHM
jgi:hypothetical protein